MGAVHRGRRAGRAGSARALGRGRAAAAAWLAGAGALPAAGLVVGLVRPQALVALTGRGWRPLDRLTGGRLRGAGQRVSVGPADTARLGGVYALNNLVRIGALLVLFAAVGGDPRRDLLPAVGAYSVPAGGWLAVFAPRARPTGGASFLVVAPVLGVRPALLLVAVLRVIELAGELLFLAIARRRWRWQRGAHDADEQQLRELTLFTLEDG